MTAGIYIYTPIEIFLFIPLYCIGTYGSSKTSLKMVPPRTSHGVVKRHARTVWDPGSGGLQTARAVKASRRSGLAKPDLPRGLCPQVLVMGLCPQVLVMGFCPQVLVMGFCPQVLVMGLCPQVLVMVWCLRGFVHRGFSIGVSPPGDVHGLVYVRHWGSWYGNPFLKH